MPKQSCRTCAFYNSPVTSDGKRKSYKHNSHACLWQMPKIDLPDSITRLASAHNRDPFKPSRWSMSPDEGTTCPVYQPFKEPPK